MPQLFDMGQRSLRRDRAAKIGPELFLYERAFQDCLERILLIHRRFERALLVGAPESSWRDRLQEFATEVEIVEPGRLFAGRAEGRLIVEDEWDAPEALYDLVLAVGTLDTVNDLPRALKLIRRATRAQGLFIGALSAGDTVPQLRNAMRAADAASGVAAPHVHPRIEPSSLAPLLAAAGFVDSVVDVDRVMVSYRSLNRLIADLRGMGATNILRERPRLVGKEARAAAIRAFAEAGDGQRTSETFEILHFAGWAAKGEMKSR